MRYSMWFNIIELTYRDRLRANTKRKDCEKLLLFQALHLIGLHARYVGPVVNPPRLKQPEGFVQANETGAEREC